MRQFSRLKRDVDSWREFRQRASDLVELLEIHKGQGKPFPPEDPAVSLVFLQPVHSSIPGLRRMDLQGALAGHDNGPLRVVSGRHGNARDALIHILKHCLMYLWIEWSSGVMIEINSLYWFSGSFRGFPYSIFTRIINNFSAISLLEYPKATALSTSTSLSLSKSELLSVFSSLSS